MILFKDRTIICLLLGITRTMSERQKLSKETIKLTQTAEQIYVTASYINKIYLFHQHGIFSRTFLIIGHDKRISKLKTKTKNIPYISDRHGVKMEKSKSNYHRKYANTFKLNKMLLNEQ